MRRLMDEYFDEARISLLFLKRVRSISFRVQGELDYGWSVTMLQPADENATSFSKSVDIKFSSQLRLGTQISGKDTWWVTTQAFIPRADLLPVNSRMVMKNPECGIAALVSSTPDSDTPNIVHLSCAKVISPRMFNRLPLSIRSDLPVHIHGTFSLSGDRQSIDVDECGAKTSGVLWNRYLLEEILPKLYLSFLESMVPQVWRHIFDFWPSKGNGAELLCKAFWEILPQSSQHLFPKAHFNVSALQCGPPESLTFSQAVFDFLPLDQSKALAPFLLAMDVNLVRELPERMVKNLKALSQVNSVTSPMLRTLLKSAKAKTCLMGEMPRNPEILQVLFSLVMPTAADIHALHGCHLVPLANSTLSTLEFKDTGVGHASRYFVASDAELKLFEFASRDLVKATIVAMLKPILDNGKFNLSKLKLTDVPKLLETKPVVQKPNNKEDKWLMDFWKYWDSNMAFSLPLPNIVTLNAKLYRARVNGAEVYASPSSFDGLPAVVEPVNNEHKQLCNGFSGLWRFDPLFMPKSLADDESCFYSAASFHRFIHSIKSLSGQGGIGTFVKTHLSADDLKVNLRSV